eukprot:5956772-Pleurochrysis_carterae.AAC.2
MPDSGARAANVFGDLLTGARCTVSHTDDKNVARTRENTLFLSTRQTSLGRCLRCFGGMQRASELRFHASGSLKLALWRASVALMGDG